MTDKKTTKKKAKAKVTPEVPTEAFGKSTEELPVTKDATVVIMAEDTGTGNTVVPDTFEEDTTVVVSGGTGGQKLVEVFKLKEGEVLAQLDNFATSIRTYFGKVIGRKAPSPPKNTKDLAEEIGYTDGVDILEEWKTAITAHTRPINRRVAPLAPKTSLQILTDLKQG